MKRYKVALRQQSFQIIRRAEQHYNVIVGHLKSLPAAVEHLTSTVALHAKGTSIFVKQRAAELRKTTFFKANTENKITVSATTSRMIQTKSLHSTNGTIYVNIKEPRILDLAQLSAMPSQIAVSASGLFAADISRLHCLRISDITVDIEGSSTYLSGINEKTLSEISYLEY